MNKLTYFNYRCKTYLQHLFKFGIGIEILFFLLFVGASSASWCALSTFFAAEFDLQSRNFAFLRRAGVPEIENTVIRIPPKQSALEIRDCCIPTNNF